MMTATTGWRKRKIMEKLTEQQQETCKECNGRGEFETGIGMMVCNDCCGTGYTTSPPVPPAHKRTWVPATEWRGLTPDEKAALFEGTAPYYNEADYADAVEAKLKEKNGYA